MNPAATTSPNWLRRLDVTGSVLSTLCAIHCLAMPLFAAALPLWGLAVFASRGWERMTATVMVALAVLCLWQGCRRHRRWWLLLLLGSGASVVLGVQFIGTDGDGAACCATERNWTEAALMFAGGLTIAVAHVLNLRYRRQCGCWLCPGAVTDPPASNHPLKRIPVTPLDS